MLVTPISLDLAQKWQAIDPNPTTSMYVADLMDRATKAVNDSDAALQELNALFPSDGTRIAFGTAGLRAAMKPGPLGMNDLTVLQTAQGLAKYCLQQQTDDTKLCAVVGYDHRCNPKLNISSLSFAVLTAMVFAEAGIDCILLDGFVLTPLVPFALKQLGAACGVMVTASHNPKQDDGYKVYASDACQIRAPMDKDIANEILNNLEPWTDYDSILTSRRQEFPNDPLLGLGRPDTTQQMLNDYFKSLQTSGLKTGQAKISSGDKSIAPPKFAYTAMHGIGYPFAKRVFETFDFDPDPTFPTVPFPNPEEKGALDLAKQFATEKGCDIVLANDPDADRLAIAEKDRSTGEWMVFHGDQIGTMIGLWIWEQIGSQSDLPVSMCVSTVSSKMLAEIGRREGFQVEETLTGFKWIGSRSAELQAAGKRNLFGYEEAIGFAW
jgi:phosphomannomutase